MKTLRIVGLVAAVLVFATTSVQANDAASGRSELTAATFLQKAAKSGLAEVELGQLAASKSASNAVREFGEQMVADHGKANERIRALAATHGVQLPVDLDEEHASTAERLEGLSGSGFDRSYADVMVHNHGKSIALFEKAADLPQADVAAFASETLPTLRLHLAHAERLQASQ